jgi:hypothetical protein
MFCSYLYKSTAGALLVELVAYLTMGRLSALPSKNIFMAKVLYPILQKLSLKKKVL